MKPLSIRLCGYGGQGIILSAIILGEAAVTKRGLYAVQTQSYGSEARGGQCQSELIISDSPIRTPIQEKNDVLVALFQTAFQTYITGLKTDGLLIVDSELVPDLSKVSSQITVYKIPATEIAIGLGNKMAANMVVLGYLQTKTNLFTKEQLLEVVQDNIKPRFWDLNKKAVEAGVQFALNSEE
ncbi:MULTISPECIES: 2-oxoacid:acceptor oxidoreductase family protein [Bacteria]|jgi:2-oxoglutarate ferredoxin oxidoreductase subunit gamma|uniref:2-oxoacid:acceptor oxidoreductase family protein n=1 Tax=Bacteria TaxID=2 RepID=UPI001BCBB3B2|nr:MULTISPECIES: 2-oxoacid:acceptor oxidoreductase family protein [unclassified Aminobacterium]MEA4877652.1 2-oxoacid:acceptor oxidoreductase family protein [Aminobacterium sp.]WMI70773.1 2-oxoacid:acceptor oxidoreductase family protein [Aminobacterium sp. MB27-C1]